MPGEGRNNTGISVGVVIPAHGHGRLTPWPKGRSGNPNGVSAAESELRRLIAANQFPKADAALTALFERGVELLNSAFPEGVNAGRNCLALWFKVCGMEQKPTDDAAIAETAKALLDAMIADAKARKGTP